MWPLVVVVEKPGVEVGLKGLDAAVELAVHRRPEELLQHRAVEPLNDAIRARRSYFGPLVLDVVEREVKLITVPLCGVELPAIVGEHRRHGQVELAVERQHLVVQHRHRRLGLLVDVEEAEGKRAMSVDDRMQIDSADALERPDHEGVGGRR